MQWKINIVLATQNIPVMAEYHCMRCTRMLFRSNRDMLVLWIGEGYPERQIPKGMGLIEHKCRGCSQVYNLYFE